MPVNVRNDIVAALRSRLSDDRPTVSAFGLTVSANAKSALLELGSGFLTVTIEQGAGVDSLRWNLSNPQYSTAGRLVSALAKQRGYVVTPDANYASDHPSDDLRVDGIVDIAGKKIAGFRHRIFSDQELAGFVDEAVSMHNPNYTLSTVPRAEHAYVLTKAKAIAYRVLAGDAAKRKGLEGDATTFLSLAQDADKQYDGDRRRMERVLPSPKTDESKVGAGDVMTGQFTRRSLRAGYTGSFRNANNMSPPQLLDFADDDVEDVQIRVRWSANKDQQFSHYELWRDYQSVVERCLAGRLSGAQYSVSPQLASGSQYSRPTSARQVFGITGSRASPMFDGFIFWTAADMTGANLVNSAFIDGVIYPGTGISDGNALGEPLEPEMDHFYRLYAVDWNGMILGSEVRRARTKPMRGRFLRLAGGMLAPGALSATSGPLAGGTALTITGTNFVTGMKVNIGAKDCTITSIASTQIVVQTPTFYNADARGRAQDIVITSPSGLRDIAKYAWSYT